MQTPAGILLCLLFIVIVQSITPIKVQGQSVVVGFTADRMTVHPGVAVNFTDQSTGSPNQWLWEFEGALTTSSSVKNPAAIIYPEPGTYQVKLTATNPDNGSGTLTKYNYINVIPLDPPAKIFDLPYFQDFTASSTSPVWGSNTSIISITAYSNLTGWTNPSFFSTYGADAFAFFYPTFVYPNDAHITSFSRCLDLRPRKAGAATSPLPYTQPVQVLTPGFRLSGADPVVSWFETSWQASNDISKVHVFNPDYRKVWASVDNANWILISSYQANEIPFSWSGGTKTDYRNVQVHLDQFGFQTGDVVRFKYDLQIGSGIYDYWILDDFYVGGSATDLTVSAGTHPEFGRVMKGFPYQKDFSITNAGGGTITITNVQILPSAGSQFFSITDIPTLPVTLKGRMGGGGVPSLKIPVQFDPAISGTFSPVMQIDFEVNGQSDSYQYILHGTGITCDDAVEIPDTDLAVSNTHNYLTEQSSVFYYTASYDQIVQVSSCDPNQNRVGEEYSWDTYLIVKKGCDGAELGRNDDIEGACQFNRTSSAVQFELSAGETCYIFWPLVFPTASHAFEPFLFGITRTASPWPDAEFFATSPRTIDEGQAVTFANNSSGAPLTSGSWEFPGGYPSTWSSLTPPAQVVYPTFGLYSVLHTTTNSSGTGTLFKSGYILALPLPDADPDHSFTATTVGSSQFFLAGGIPLKATKSGADEAWIFKDLTHSGRNWQIRNTGVGGCSTDEAVMPSTTGPSGYLVLPVDEYSCMNGLQSNLLIEAYAQSPSFDCSEYDAVIYEFQHRFRYSAPWTVMELQVSTDEGLNWKSYNLIENREENVTWGDPVILERVNISEVAQHQPDVRIRFYWKGSTGYFWMIDDIEIKGYKACENFSATIDGVSQVYRGYSPLSSSTLNVTINGGVGPYTYEWSTGETTRDIIATPLVTTEYQVLVSDVQGCKASAIFTVNVEDIRCGQNLDKVLMCKKDKNGKGTEICVAASAVPAQLKTGAALGSCKGKLGYTGESDLQDIESKLVVYPNPNNGLATIHLSGLEPGRLQIIIKDLLGKTVHFEEDDNQSEQLTKNITIKAAGVYHLIVVTSAMTLTERFTVIR
jgi:PKD repeat protein